MCSVMGCCCWCSWAGDGCWSRSLQGNRTCSRGCSCWRKRSWRSSWILVWRGILINMKWACVRRLCCCVLAFSLSCGRLCRRCDAFSKVLCRCRFLVAWTRLARSLGRTPALFPWATSPVASMAPVAACKLQHSLCNPCRRRFLSSYQKWSGTVLAVASGSESSRFR